MQYVESAPKISTYGLLVTNPLQVAIVGSWISRQAEPLLDLSDDAARHRVRKGTFRAIQEPTPYGYTWQVELLEKSALKELRYLQEMLYRSSYTQPDAVSGTFPPGFRSDETQSGEHGDLMAVLKDELEVKYGQVEEMHVLFHQVNDLPLPRRYWGRIQPWWHRVWRRLSGASGEGSGYSKW